MLCTMYCPIFHRYCTYSTCQVGIRDIDWQSNWWFPWQDIQALSVDSLQSFVAACYQVSTIQLSNYPCCVQYAQLECWPAQWKARPEDWPHPWPSWPRLWSHQAAQNNLTLLVHEHLGFKFWFIIYLFMYYCISQPVL